MVSRLLNLSSEGYIFRIKEIARFFINKDLKVVHQVLNIIFFRRAGFFLKFFYNTIDLSR